MSEYDTANEHELCFQIGKLKRRIAELEAEVTKGHELQDAYCDRIAELEAGQLTLVLDRIVKLEKKVDQILYEIELPRKSSLSDLMYPKIKYKITSADEPEVQE